MRNLDSRSADLLEFNEFKKYLQKYARTSLGREKIESLHPLQDLSVIQRCHQQTMEICEVIKGGTPFALLGVKDYKPYIEQALGQGRVMEPKELLDIADTLQSADFVRRHLLRLPVEKFPRLRHLSQHFYDFSEICQAIYQAVSSQEEILDGASLRLKSIREEKSALEKKIHQALRKILENKRAQKALQSEQPVLRGDRLCLAVKSSFRRDVRGMILDSSSTGQTLFIEPESVIPMGNRLAELKYNERNEINRILRRLTVLVLEKRESLLHTLDALAWIDFTQAKGEMAIELNMEAPIIGQNNLLKLKDARHPLLLSLLKETCSPAEMFQKVVPLNISLGEGASIMIITGPNTGGKTIALKTVGLLTLMAQSGVPIPAGAGSQIPVYDRVYASIGDEQSIFNSLSTFSSHIQRLIEILRQASSQSLVLIDEFGSGTDPEEAAALSESILHEISAKKSHTILTTHLGLLKKYAYQNPQAINASVEFDIKTLQPTYRLITGVPGNSKALVIARDLGMDPQIIERAEKILNQSEDKAWIDRLQKAVGEAEKFQQEAEALKKRTEQIQREIELERNILEEKKKVLQQEMDLEIEFFRRKVHHYLEDSLKPFQNVSKALQEKALEIQEFLKKILGETSLGEKRLLYARRLKKRKKTFVISLAQPGTVTRINKAREEVKVKVGNMEVMTNFEDLSWIGEISWMEDFSKKEELEEDEVEVGEEHL